jgi:hypothetical protein
MEDFKMMEDELNKRMKYGTTTITLSIPVESRSFFDDLAEDGYNRSYLMLKMTRILEILYRKHLTFPGGLPKAIDRLLEMAEHELRPSPRTKAPGSSGNDTIRQPGRKPSAEPGDGLAPF